MMLDSTVLREVAIQVSGYFRDFLESDFKKQSAPRRRILLQSSEGFRCGMRTKPYEELERALWELIGKASGAPELLKVAPRQYTRPISTNLRLVIASQIEQIRDDALFRVVEALHQRITETLAKGSADAEAWIEEVQTFACEQVGERIVRPLVQKLDEPLRRSSYDVIDSLYSAETDMVRGVAQPLLAVLPQLLARHLTQPDAQALKEALRRNFYKHDDHVKIAQLLGRQRFTRPWVVSYDNAKEIREMYAYATPYSYGLHYTAQRRYTGSEVMFFSKRLKAPLDTMEKIAA